MQLFHQERRVRGSLTQTGWGLQKREPVAFPAPAHYPDKYAPPIRVSPDQSSVHTHAACRARGTSTRSPSTRSGEVGLLLAGSGRCLHAFDAQDEITSSPIGSCAAPPETRHGGDPTGGGAWTGITLPGPVVGIVAAVPARDRIADWAPYAFAYATSRSQLGSRSATATNDTTPSPDFAPSPCRPTAG
ncbi:hypothetical protein GCM10010260_58840 [Streptomyces filipinensis]|uniref:Uncharacterized protein n=1 Tax=Streptomyces filipinensis TaxID=66887 RepID=A0A918IFL6_9ACTN|nr:hypothetical protein GCM10010260_58840 [Streptomyces filipinensis]